MKLKWSPLPWVCFAMCVGVMGTALISPLYPLYKEAWHLQASDISVIYVVYMAGALFSLLFLGQLSDRIGFHKVMQLALGLALAGTTLSMVAWNMASLNVARFIVGVASSLMTTSASIGLTALSPKGNVRRAAMLTGFLIAFGFGIGPLMGGIIGQWMPQPLVITYVPTIVLGGVGMYALRRISLPDHARFDGNPALASSGGWQQWLPRLTWPRALDSVAFVLTSCCPFLAFGVFGLYASMSPLFIEKMITWHGPFVSGTAIAVILLLSAGVQLLAGRLPTRWCGLGGMLVLVLCNGILLVNLWLGSLLLFALGIVTTAAGHGMCMLAGINMVNRIAQPHNRAGLLATYFVIGYIGSMAPMLGMGWIADHWGLQVAVTVFCCSVMAVGTVAALCFFRHPRMSGE
jgi:MFS family permease